MFGPGGELHRQSGDETVHSRLSHVKAARKPFENGGIFRRYASGSIEMTGTDFSCGVTPESVSCLVGSTHAGQPTAGTNQDLSSDEFYFLSPVSGG